VLPYVKRLSEKLSAVLRSNNIDTSLNSHTIIQNFVVHPKDKIVIEEKCGVVEHMVVGYPTLERRDESR